MSLVVVVATFVQLYCVGCLEVFIFLGHNGNLSAR
jgi:hypothetical protein